MGRNNDHLVDKLSFEDTAFTLTSSYNKQQTTTTNMVFGSRLSLSAMLALGLCLSQGTATEAAGITQLFNHAVRRFGEKAVENGVPAGVRVGANLAHIPTMPAGDRRKLQAGITQLFNHAVRRFGEKAVENGVPAGVRVGANLAHIPTTPADNRKLLGIGD